MSFRRTRECQLYNHEDCGDNAVLDCSKYSEDDLQSIQRKKVDNYGEKLAVMLHDNRFHPDRPMGPQTSREFVNSGMMALELQLGQKYCTEELLYRKRKGRFQPEVM